MAIDNDELYGRPSAVVRQPRYPRPSFTSSTLPMAPQGRLRRPSMDLHTLPAGDGLRLRRRPAFMRQLKGALRAHGRYPQPQNGW